MSQPVLIDLILVVLLVAYAISGYRQGLVVGSLSLVGFLGGAVVGMTVVPDLVREWTLGFPRVVLVVVGVLLLVWLGQLLGVLIGRRLRDLVTWRPARLVDSLLGAVAGVVAVALITWFIAGALRGSPYPSLSRAVAASRVVAAVDSVVPVEAGRFFNDFRSTVEGGAFPRVFDGIALEEIRPVDPPDPAEATTQGVAAAAASIVKVTGVAHDCSRGQEGTGWVVSPQRVVTNAHVVAGIDAPLIQVGGEGPRLEAEVVLFDPAKDLAVLAVPDLQAPPLTLGVEAERGDPTVVAGYPLDGPFSVEAGRVRQVLDARGEDIYGNPGVSREVYSLFARVEPGNSGGPLLSPDGSVVGVIFAKSLDDATTGYALTLGESAEVLEAAAAAGEPVPTGPCTRG